MQKNNNKLIHIARIQPKGKRIVYLFLREIAEDHYRWFEEQDQEVETPVHAHNIEEAIRLANQHWNNLDVAFRTVICGFRYSLPERDEHGTNALFHQMISSYSSTNGVYLDKEIGHNCIVHNASIEARELWYRLRKEQKL